MAEESTQPPSVPLNEDADVPLSRPKLTDQALNWLAALPWWAIILGVVAISVLYSMFSSTIYQNIIKFVTDNPQVTTDEFLRVVKVYEEKKTVSGTFVSQTEDSTQTVTLDFLRSVMNADQEGYHFKVSELPPAVLVIKDDATGEQVAIQKDWITHQEPANPQPNDPVTIDYVIPNSVVTGTVVDETSDSLKIRTVDPVDITFDASRIMGDPTPTPCDENSGPACQDWVTIERSGEVLNGTLQTLSQTNLRIKTSDGTVREIRRGDVDYFYVPTLSVALYEPSAEEVVTPDEALHFGFVDSPDIRALLADNKIELLTGLSVPLEYAGGTAQTDLTAYDTLDAGLEAVNSGEITALFYVDTGPDRRAIVDWDDENPDAQVILPELTNAFGSQPGVIECAKDCQVSLKLKDDTITGRILPPNDTILQGVSTLTNQSQDELVGDQSSTAKADLLTVRTVEAQYRTINRSAINEGARQDKEEPGACALNNIRGCNAGIFLTLRVTFLAYGLALMLGLLFGLLRVSKNPIFYAVSTLYVEVIRGIPLLVILLYAGFVVSPQIRDHTPLDPGTETMAIAGLAFGYGAFIAEIFRAGIQSISRGQMEAARSLGMSYPQAMRYVILPQAVRVVLPPLGNDLISMLKDSALISVLALPDLLQLGRLSMSRNLRAFESFNTVAILYLLMTIFLSVVVRVIERRTRLPR